MPHAPLIGTLFTVTMVDFVALGPTPLEQVSVKVVVVRSAPELLLPLAAGVAAPTPLSMEQVMVPPPVTPLQVSVVLEPPLILEGEDVKEPIATFARQELPLQVLPAAQLAVTVLAARAVPSPFLRMKVVWGLVTETVKPAELLPV